MSKKKYQKPAVYVMATVIGLLQGSELGPGATDVRNPDGSPVIEYDYSIWDDYE